MKLNTPQNIRINDSQHCRILYRISLFAWREHPPHIPLCKLGHLHTKWLACRLLSGSRKVFRIICSVLLLMFLVGKPEGKRPLGRPRRRWEDNIRMDLQEVGGSCGDWKELAQDRDRWRALVGTVRNLRVPKMRGISWLAAEPVSFSRRTLLHGVSK